jgi:hypothetical protein
MNFVIAGDSVAIENYICKTYLFNRCRCDFLFVLIQKETKKSSQSEGFFAARALRRKACKTWAGTYCGQATHACILQKFRMPCNRTGQHCFACFRAKLPD